MDDGAAAYLAVGFPWDSGWDVVVLDPAGAVIAVSSARDSADVERVGRRVLRDRIPGRRQPVRLRVHCCSDHPPGGTTVSHRPVSPLAGRPGRL